MGKKLVAPIIITIFSLCFMLFYYGLIFAFIPLSFWIKALIGILPSDHCCIKALKSRRKKSCPDHQRRQYGRDHNCFFGTAWADHQRPYFHSFCFPAG